MVTSFIFKNGTTENIYFYVRDIFGIINYLIDISGAIVVFYSYDSWGKLLSTGGTLSSTVGVQNPFLYKGYYFDFETSLYYCHSRYYNPMWSRWLNADSVDNLDAKPSNGFNLFAYCGNNPIMGYDPSGKDWNSFWNIFLGFLAVVGAVALIAAAVFIGGPVLIGAAIVGGIGMVAGGIYSGINYGEGSIGLGMLAGLGIGTLVGALGGVIYGVATGTQLIGTAGKIFYSGGAAALEAAREYASTHPDAITIADTNIGRFTEWLTRNMPIDSQEYGRIWNFASKIYACGAGGTVNVFLGPNIRDESAWLLSEKPILEFYRIIRQIIEIITHNV